MDKVDNITKGIIFSGDSFTWGEGLELFSNLPSTLHYKEQRKYSMEGEYNHAWDPKYLYPHRMYQQKKRFARLVADYFDTWEDVYDRNGGCPYSNLDELFYQINRSPLTDVSDIVIQITDIWRGVPLFYAPETHYFGLSYIPGDASKTYLKWFNPLGNGKGLKYIGIEGEITEDRIENLKHEYIHRQFRNGLQSMLQVCMEYEYLKNTNMSDEEFTNRISKYDINDIEFVKFNIVNIYKYFLTEYSEFGNNMIEIYDNLTKELCRRYLSFVKEYIKPLADEHSVRISFFPPFNETYIYFLQLNDEFYNQNRIQIHYDGRIYESWGGFLQNKFDIVSTPTYEWTNNQHPNLEGHKIIADSIIKHFNK